MLSCLQNIMLSLLHFLDQCLYKRNGLVIGVPANDGPQRFQGDTAKPHVRRGRALLLRGAASSRIEVGVLAPPNIRLLGAGLRKDGAEGSRFCTPDLLPKCRSGWPLGPLVSPQALWRLPHLPRWGHRTPWLNAWGRMLWTRLQTLPCLRQQCKPHTFTSYKLCFHWGAQRGLKVTEACLILTNFFGCSLLEALRPSRAEAYIPNKISFVAPRVSRPASILPGGLPRRLPHHHKPFLFCSHFPSW